MTDKGEVGEEALNRWEKKKEVSYKKYYVFSLYVLVRFLWSFPFSSTWAQTGIRAKFQFQGEY